MREERVQMESSGIRTSSSNYSMKGWNEQLLAIDHSNAATPYCLPRQAARQFRSRRRVGFRRVFWLFSFFPLYSSLLACLFVSLSTFVSLCISST